MTTDELILRRALGEATPEDHVEWAVGALVDGLDSPSLRILAGLDPMDGRPEVESCFVKCAGELQLSTEALQPTAMDTATVVRRLFEGARLSPEETVRHMSGLYHASGYSDPRFRIWYHMDEELSLLADGSVGAFYPPRALSMLDRTVRTEWRLFDLLVELDPPADYLSYIRCERCSSIGLPLRERISAPSRALQTRDLPVEVRRVCAVCGSARHRSMSDPDVREEYFGQRASGRGD